MKFQIQLSVIESMKILKIKLFKSEFLQHNFKICLPRLVKTKFIALDKALFQPKRIYIFLISRRKHMLWILIRSALVRHF